MLTKGLTVLRTAKLLKQNVNTHQPFRNSHDFNYRCASPPAPKGILLAAEGVAGFAWWWVLWHIFTEPGHILGEFPYPDPRKWSDEELGIPPVE